jgi:hypothetical protein
MQHRKPYTQIIIMATTRRSKSTTEETRTVSEASLMTPTRTTPESSIATPITSQGFLPTPPETKRKKTCRDSPIPFKIRKTTSTPKAVTRPETLNWLADLEDEDYEPPQSPTPAGSGAIEEQETSDDEEEKVSKLRPKTFQCGSFTKSWAEIGQERNFEFFQAYPHDEFSTLCVGHFMQLAENWYSRRKSMVNNQVQEIIRGGLTQKPDFSKLALPVCDETWTVKSLQDFKVDLHNAINDASSRVRFNHKQTLQATGKRPICELGNQEHPLKCPLCTNYELPCKGNYVEVDKAHCRTDIPPYFPDSFDAELEKASRPIPDCCHQKALMILGGDKGRDYMECEECCYSQELPQNPLQMPKEFAIRVAGNRIPVKVRPERLYLNSKLGHVDVSGIHIIVDHCVGEPMIKFQ